jgi:hypothetical protein
VEYLNQVITLDPDYAPAHASLAVAYTQLGFLSAIPHEDGIDYGPLIAEWDLATTGTFRRRLITSAMSRSGL